MYSIFYVFSRSLIVLVHYYLSNFDTICLQDFQSALQPLIPTRFPGIREAGGGGCKTKEMSRKNFSKSYLSRAKNLQFLKESLKEKEHSKMKERKEARSL